MIMIMIVRAKNLQSLRGADAIILSVLSGTFLGERNSADSVLRPQCCVF